MKLLCLLLSLYVVLLSARPCCADNCRENSTVAKKELSGKSNSQEKTCPGCSPFFSCGTCAGFVVAKPVTHNLPLIAESRVITYTPYQQPNLKEIAQAIWQPPQLG